MLPSLTNMHRHLVPDPPDRCKWCSKSFVCRVHAHDCDSKHRVAPTSKQHPLVEGGKAPKWTTPCDETDPHREARVTHTAKNIPFSRLEGTMSLLALVKVEMQILPRRGASTKRCKGR